MIERHVIIDNVDPVVFYGVNNCNIQLIRNLFPKLRMAARGNVIKVIGDEEETALFEQKVKELADFCNHYNQLNEEVIIDTIKGTPPKELKMDDAIIFGVNGKPIKARTPNQQLLVKTFTENDLTFALGPAGTGKTYLAVAMAVRALKNREVRKIILSRRGSRRETRFPARRHEGQNRPLSPAALRCPRRHDSERQVEGIYGNEGDSNSPLGIYAWPHAQRRHRGARRGAKHHHTPNQDVSHTPRHGQQDDCDWRRDANRLASHHRFGLDSGTEDFAQRERHRQGGI